jgi:hypothetical protein
LFLFFSLLFNFLFALIMLRDNPPLGAKTYEKFIQSPSKGRQGLEGKGIHKESTNGGVQARMAVMEKKLDMFVKAMTNHSIALAQQVTQVEVCAICSHIDHTIETCSMSSIADQELKENVLESAVSQFLKVQQ